MWREVVLRTTISSGTGTATSTSIITGMLMDVVVNVFASDGVTPSSNTVTVALQELGAYTSTLFTKTSVTGASNRYAPEIQIQDSSGTATGLYRPYAITQALRVNCSSGTNGDIVLVYIKLIG